MEKSYIDDGNKVVRNSRY